MNLFDPATAQDLTRRIGLLRTDLGPLWGTMRPAQAVAHGAAGMEMANGDRLAPRLILGRIIGRLGTPLVLDNDRPMRRQTPTVPGREVRDERDLAHEHQRLYRLIDRFVVAGPERCTSHPHRFFLDAHPHAVGGPGVHTSRSSCAAIRRLGYAMHCAKPNRVKDQDLR